MLGSAPNENETWNKTSMRASRQNSETVLNPKKDVRFKNPELTLLSRGIVMVEMGKQKVADCHS